MAPETRPRSALSLLLAERIRERLAVLNLTPNEASIRAGFDRKKITSILNGRSQNPSAETLIPLARLLGVSVEYLTGRVDEIPLSGLTTPAKSTPGGLFEVRLSVTHYVQAGVWREGDPDVADASGEALFFVRDPFAGAKQWAEIVRTSGHYPDGSVLRVVDADAIRYEPRQGHRVICLTHRGQSLFERSVREVIVTDEAVILVSPGAENRKLGNFNGLSTKIVGLVRGSYAPE